MRNRPIMIMCAWFSVFQTVSFAVLSWDDLWAGMHIPRDTWMPCKRTAQHPIAFARLHKP